MPLILKALLVLARQCVEQRPAYLKRTSFFIPSYFLAQK